MQRLLRRRGRRLSTTHTTTDTPTLLLVRGYTSELIACAGCGCATGGGGALAALDAPVWMGARTVALQYNDNKFRYGGNYISSGVIVAVLIAGGCASARAMHPVHVQSRAFTATCGSPHSFSSAQDGQ